MIQPLLHKLVLSLALFSILTACDSEPESNRCDNIEPSSKILDGQFDQGTASVFFVRTVFEESCSGVLISENVILTAYHCVRETTSLVFTSDEVVDAITLAVNNKPLRSCPGALAVKEVVVPDAEADSAKGRDLALLVLRNPVEARRAQPLIPRLDLDVVPDEPYSAVGYGFRGYEESSLSGERYRRDGLTVGGKTDYFGDWVDFDGATAPGDSGGPALDRNEQVIGVTSYASLLESGEVTGWYYTSVYEFGDWLKAETARAAIDAGLTPPTWTQDGFRSD